MKSTTFSVLVAVLVVGLTLPAGFAGPALAHDTGDRDVIIHENTTAGSDVAEVWVDVAGADSIDTTDNTTTARVVIQGVNGTNTTELLNQSLTVSEGNVSSATYETTENDSSDYDEFHVAVTTANGSSTHIDTETTEWGTLTENIGGGGGGLPGGALGGGVGAVAILGAGYLLLREE